MSDVFARRQFERGRQFELQDRLEEAVRAYEAACSMNPGFPDPYYALGRIEANRNRFEAALTLFDQALAISPDPQILEWRAYVCGRLRRYDEALADYRAVVDAGEHQARVNLGRMLLALRRYDEAEEALKDADDASSAVLLAALPRYREFAGGERVDDLRAVRYLFATNVVLGTFGDGGLALNPRRYLLLSPVHIAVTVRRLQALVERKGWRFDGVAGAGPHHGPVARLCAHALGVDVLTAAPGPGCRVLLCSAVLKSVAEARAAEAAWRDRGVRVLHFALALVPDGDPDPAEPELLGWVGRAAVPWHRVEPMSRLEPDASVTDGAWPGFRVGPPVVDPNQERVSAGLIEAFEEGRRDVALRDVLDYYLIRHPQVRAFDWDRGGTLEGGGWTLGVLILAACAEEAVEPAAATAPSAAPLSAAPPVPDRGVPDAQSPDARVADATPADAAPTDAAAPEADAAAGGFRIIAGAAIVEEEATRPKAPVRKSLPVMKRPKPVAPPTAAPAPVAPAAPRLSPMQVIRNHNGDVHTCYARVALKDPTVRGRITVQWTIGKDGMPMAVAITQDTLKDKSVGACLKERARQWRFAPPGGGVQVISYPFDLSVQ